MTSAERTARYRAKMRARGLRLRQFWLPDTSDPAWRAEAARQSRLLAESDDTREAQRFIDALNEELLAGIEADEAAASRR